MVDQIDNGINIAFPHAAQAPEQAADQRNPDYKDAAIRGYDVTLDYKDAAPRGYDVTLGDSLPPDGTSPVEPSAEEPAPPRMTDMDKLVLEERFKNQKERIKKFNYHMEKCVKLGLEEFSEFMDTMDFAVRFRDHLIDAQLLVSNAHNYLVPVPTKTMIERAKAHAAGLAPEVTVPSEPEKQGE